MAKFCESTANVKGKQLSLRLVLQGRKNIGRRGVVRANPFKFVKGGGEKIF